MKVTLIKKVTEALSTESFFWQPEKKVDFFPGQYFYYTLPKLNYPDDRGDTRHFTIASSPTEDYLQLTTRIREQSGYKKTLHELSIGAVIEGQGPEGTFTLTDNETDPQIFLAGGIGITPFRCMIKYAIDKQLATPLHLIYSNSDSDFVFKKDLDIWAKMGINLKIEYIDTSVSGHLDKSKIEQFIKNWQLKIENCKFWTAGPSAFVSAIEDILEGLKVDSDRVRSDKFNGY